MSLTASVNPSVNINLNTTPSPAKTGCPHTMQASSRAGAVPSEVLATLEDAARSIETQKQLTSRLDAIIHPPEKGAGKCFLINVVVLCYH